MFGRDKAAAPLVSLGVILILAVCACSVAAHLVADGLITQAEGPGFDFAAERVGDDFEHEHADDHFIVLAMGLQELEYFLAPLTPCLQCCSLSVYISPLLPPPNF
jgi:hypothetical protein